MKHIRILRVGWILALASLVLGITFMTPALASNSAAQHGSRTAKQAYGSSLNAIVYLTTGSLAATFQIASTLRSQEPLTRLLLTR